MAENYADIVRTVGFRKAVEFALNETPGKFSGLCGSKGSYSNKLEQIEDRFGDLYAEEIDERNGDTKNVDPDVERRWIAKPKRASVAPLLDPDDQMSTEVGLKSPLSVGVARAIRRYQDDKFLQGFYGTAYVGEQESLSAVPFKSANVMPVDYGITGTPTGLTLAKLIGIKKYMRKNLVDLEVERPVIITTSEQEEDLLNIMQIQSRDYNPMTQQVLQSGKVVSFMGMDFLQAEIGNPKAYKLSASLTVDGSGYRRLPVFLRSGMHWGNWLDFEGHADLRPDKNHSEQIAGYTCGASTRVLEDKCYQILCAE